MTELRVVMEEVIPALSAAGLTGAELRAWSADIQQRMGPGGTLREWVIAMGRTTAALDNPLAEQALLLALDKVGSDRREAADGY